MCCSRCVGIYIYHEKSAPASASDDTSRLHSYYSLVGRLGAAQARARPSFCPSFHLSCLSLFFFFVLAECIRTYIYIYISTLSDPSLVRARSLVCVRRECRRRVRVFPYSANPTTPNQVFEGIAGELDSKLAAAAATSMRGGGEGGNVVEEATLPIEGMKPGTSGLRKKVGHGEGGGGVLCGADLFFMVYRCFTDCRRVGIRIRRRRPLSARCFLFRVVFFPESCEFCQLRAPTKVSASWQRISSGLFGVRWLKRPNARRG